MQLTLMGFALTAAMSGHADIFKCVDESGHPTYQGTDCDAGEHARQIDRRFSNVGRLGLAAEEQARIDKLHRERRARAAEAIAERNSAIDHALKQQAREEAKCARLKEAVQALYVRRRYERIDRDARDQLVRQMRDACAP
ncbi:MAG: DUF4124 domain-containing protein [Gammaproteobacteria bacterium]|nr:DUF4124 domain-containing protein [Gammaproteobacteria bacterium]